MLEAPPNRKATFPAIAKAWPCLLKMTRTIRKSNYQLPHFFFTKKPILSIFSVFSTLLLEALNGFMSSHGSKRSCRESESSVQSEIVKCFVTAQKQVWQTLDMGRLLSSLFPATDRLLMPSSHLLCLCLSLLHTHTEHTVSPINQSF